MHLPDYFLKFIYIEAIGLRERLVASEFTTASKTVQCCCASSPRPALLPGIYETTPPRPLGTRNWQKVTGKAEVSARVLPTQ